MSTARPRRSNVWRLAAASLVGLGLFVVSPGCGLFLQNRDPAAPHWGPRPFKSLRDRNRDRDLKRAIEHDKFPRAEQVGIKPVDSKDDAEK